MQRNDTQEQHGCGVRRGRSLLFVLSASLCGWLVLPGMAAAASEASEHHSLSLPFWTVIPFAGLLACIALLPMVAGLFWHSNVRKLLVSLIFAIPVAAYLYWHEQATGEHSIEALLHGLKEYTQFIILLFSLYTVAGGIVVEGDFRPKPLTNTGFLACGSVLANFIGTTGASMILIRPMLRINATRQFAGHLPIFFIFVVSNVGGLLTPLGDPPLFLGFLRGVGFFWTAQLWPQWLLVNALVLGVFFLWDWLTYRRESREATNGFPDEPQPLRIRGTINFLFLVGILGAVLLQSKAVSEGVTEAVRQVFPGSPSLQLVYPLAEIVMLLMAGLSWFCTRRALRRANAFNWEAIVEVAVLFIGIFVAMVPALSLLESHSDALGLEQAWQYFWFTGALSGFLDNAPTYVTFATVAAGEQRFGPLSLGNESIKLVAISCGAVFMGALTYIGNGPNFMVKAISESSGYRTPSFFGYMVYSLGILVPIYLLVTYIFFL